MAETRAHLLHEQRSHRPASGPLRQPGLRVALSAARGPLRLLCRHCVQKELSHRGPGLALPKHRRVQSARRFTDDIKDEGQPFQDKFDQVDGLELRARSARGRMSCCGGIAGRKLKRCDYEGNNSWERMELHKHANLGTGKLSAISCFVLLSRNVGVICDSGNSEMGHYHYDSGLQSTRVTCYNFLEIGSVCNR